MASEDRQYAADGAVRTTPLERRSRRLLRVYPAAYQRDRGEEIIGTLLEATPEGRTWPRLRDVRALTVGGLKSRAAQNRQRSASANLRVAVMVGISIYLVQWLVASYLDGVVGGFVPNSLHTPDWTGWAAPLAALLTAATVALAWTAPRVGVLVGALTASAAVVSLALASGGIGGWRVVQVLCLGALAAFARRVERPSRHWLWLPGLIAVASPLVELGVGYGWLGYSDQELMPGSLLLAFALAGLLWMVIDARLAVAVITYFVATTLQAAATFPANSAAFLAMLPGLLIFAAVAVPAVWLLRRQSERPAR